jgi:hypothetical protein
MIKAGKEKTVQVLPPNQEMQRKVGGPMGKLLTPAVAAAAEAALSQHSSEIRTEVHAAIARIQVQAMLRPPGTAAAAIAQDSHFIRSLAGSFGWGQLGQIADLLCRYVDDLPPEVPIDANLVTLMAVALKHLSQEGGCDPELTADLLAECQEAVVVSLGREGRSLPS